MLILINQLNICVLCIEEEVFSWIVSYYILSNIRRIKYNYYGECRSAVPWSLRRYFRTVNDRVACQNKIVGKVPFWRLRVAI